MNNAYKSYKFNFEQSFMFDGTTAWLSITFLLPFSDVRFLYTRSLTQTVDFQSLTWKTYMKSIGYLGFDSNQKRLGIQYLPIWPQNRIDSKRSTNDSYDERLNVLSESKSWHERS